ncbi:HlyD family secretion protein [Desulfosporosinus orientis]|nr:efflux RND transporter periplasmic adaptor subunit [Desulfosporosinus orientis]
MKKRLVIGLIIGLMILTVTGCGKEPPKVTDQSAAKPEAQQFIEAFGVVKSTEVKNITIDYPSEVAKINVVEGQRVKKGDVLVTLDSRSYSELINNKELELKTLQVELSSLKRDYEKKSTSLVNNTDPEILRYLNDKQHAEDLYQQALEDLAAQQALYESGALSLNELNEFKSTVDAKKKAVEDAHFLADNTRKGIQEKLDQLQTSIDEKSLQVTSKQLDLQADQDKMNKSYIKGNDVIVDVPNGVVTDINCSQGDIIMDDEGKKLLSVLNRDSVVIEADVAEEFIKDVRLGAEVIINPQADKAKVYNGKVISIAEKAVLKNNETIVPVRISIENLDSFLLPEFNVDVQIKFESKKQSQ